MKNVDQDLLEVYAEWREAGESASEGADVPFTWDCGDQSERDDFNEYAGFYGSESEEVSFEEMQELERAYTEEYKVIKDRKKRLVGVTWGSVSKGEREKLLEEADVWLEETLQNGDLCIVDFPGIMSVSATYIKNEEYCEFTIDDNSVIYDSEQ